jgi:signal transduction histidine kinase
MSEQHNKIPQKQANTAPSRFSLRYSMGAQIGAAMFGFILLSGICAFLFSAWRQEVNGNAFLLAQARSIGMLVAAGSSDGVTFADRKLLSRAASGVEGLKDFGWVIIRNNNGDTLYTTNFEKAPNALRNGGAIMPLDSVRTVLEDNGDVIVAVPVRQLVGSDRIGEVMLELKPTAIRENIARSRTITMFWAIIASLVCGGIAFVVAKWLVRPLRRLYVVAEKVAAGDLHQRAPEVFGVAALSEAGVLTGAFNSMMNRLEMSDSELRSLNSTLENVNSELEQVNTEMANANAQLELRTMELSQANEQISEQNSILKDLKAEQDEFIGIASHDLKNPLTGIQGLSELLMNERDLPKESIRNMAGAIHKSSLKMFELVKNLLDVNALERGGQQFNITTFDIAPSLSFATDLYNGRGAEKNIMLHFDYPKNATTMVLADRLAVEQIIDNIISNAVKYSPHGKNVWVSVEERTMTLKANENMKNAIVFAVRDEGPGLSEEDKGKLFGKFSRLSAQPTGGEHSTGLGLSIVKKMVELMNGKVWCESELGKGATFLVALPAPKVSSL